MALLAEVASIGISDPIGDQVAIRVAYLDDALTDQKTGGPVVVATKTFLFSPGATKAALYDSVARYGETVMKARADAAMFAATYPPGYRITVG